MALQNSLEHFPHKKLIPQIHIYQDFSNFFNLPKLDSEKIAKKLMQHCCISEIIDYICSIINAEAV